MEKPRAVIYDNDGMVAHGGRLSEQYAREFNLNIAVMDPFFAGPFKKCMTGEADLREELEKVITTWGWKGTVDELMQYWFSIGATLDEDVYASIAKLRAQDLVVCLATNQERYRLNYFVEKFSYDKIFNEVFCASELGALKQSAEGAEKIFQTLKERHGILDKGEVMYWDDREGNVESLNAMGFNAQMYRGYPAFKEVMAEHGFQL